MKARWDLILVPSFILSFVLMAADRNAGRSILVFKHDEDKVS